MRIIILIILSFGIIFSIGCKDNLTDTIVEESYVVLNIGDVRQFYNPRDSSHFNLSYVGKAQRADGLEVIIGVWQSSYDKGVSSDSAYYFIRDGYYWESDIDTNNYFLTKWNNPFAEMKHAKLNPEDGDEWEAMINNPIIKFTASYLSELKTLCKTFEDVYVFTTNQSMSYFYAKNYGLIASHPYDNILTTVNYICIKDIEIGEYVPLDKAEDNK